jgi:uncharacterized protein (DUF952 family)
VTILHLLPAAVWERLGPGDTYEPASLVMEGFVHCTGTDELMLRVANAFYTSEAGPMVVLTLDEDLLASEVRWEAAPGADPLAGERFPHIYGPLEADAVVSVRAMERAPDGTYSGIAASL